jgi:hypothetical protein
VLAIHSPPVKRRWLLGGAAACMACVLLGDSRGPLASGLVVALYFLVSKRQKAVQWVAGLLPLLPVILVAGLNLIAGLGVASIFSRAGGGSGGSFATATGRTQFWSDAWHVLQHPSLQEVIGWGANGQVSSGASKLWAYSFRGILANPASANVHDLVLQTIFDAGLIGLLALAIAVFAALRTLADDVEIDRASPARALRAMLIALVISGITEASPTYLAPQALITMLLLMGAAAGLRMDTDRRTVFA